MPAPLDSRQLLAFAVAANLGSFTLAAKELEITQSAVSHAMKALEKDIGYRLFKREPRRVTLTAAGEKLRRHVDRILAEMDAARSPG